MSPLRSSGRSSSASRKPWFVVPPSTTTIVSASARCSRASASSRSRPQAMILAIIESNSAGITSPSATPVSTRTPGPGGQPQQRDPVRVRGQEAARGILGVDARLDRVPVRRRRLALEPAAGGHVQLELDEVDAR